MDQAITGFFFLAYFVAMVSRKRLSLFQDVIDCVLPTGKPIPQVMRVHMPMAKAPVLGRNGE